MLYVLCSKKIRSTLFTSRGISAIHRGNNPFNSISNNQLRNNITSSHKDKFLHTSTRRKNSYKATDSVATNAKAYFWIFGSATVGYNVCTINDGNDVLENSKKTANYCKLKNGFDDYSKKAIILATSAEDSKSEKIDEFEHLNKEWDDFMHTAIYGDDDDDDEDEDEDEDEEDEENGNKDCDTDDDEEEANSLNLIEVEDVHNDGKEFGDSKERSSGEQFEDNQSINKESENENLESKTDLPLSAFALEPDYSLLPQEDEPTTCSICLINRQGPCRNHWRWFEKCLKLSSTHSSDQSNTEEYKQNDNSIDQGADIKNSDSEDDLGQKETNYSSNSSSDFDLCMKASMVWMECVDQHRSLYSYYTNRHFQPELITMEQNISETNKSNSFSINMKPSLDLISYQEFMETLTQQSTETAKSNLLSEDPISIENNLQANVQSTENHPDIQSSINHDTNHGKNERKKDKNSPPEHLIPSYAKIQLLDENTSYPIEIGYIKDQNGDLLGFDYFSREKKENLQSGDITFHLTPETTSVSVFCLYRKPRSDKKDEDPKENMDEINDGENVSNQEEKLYYSTIQLQSYISDTQ